MSGWYMVYIITIVLNSILSTLSGYNLFTWQYWAWSILIILAYSAGNNNN